MTLNPRSVNQFIALIFPGDSGALTLGAMYGTIAIIGHVEIIAAVALLPAVINSFLFLSSMKRIVEHRQIKGKPTENTDDFKLKATSDKTAPVTLVRLILAGGPLCSRPGCCQEPTGFGLQGRHRGCIGDPAGHDVVD